MGKLLLNLLSIFTLSISTLLTAEGWDFAAWHPEAPRGVTADNHGSDSKFEKDIDSK